MRILLGLLVLSAACARDFAVSPPAEEPILESFTPDSAFGGDILALVGQNFEPVAESNRVHFTGETAPGLAFDDQGRLLVRIPQDASFGPLAVSNRGGTSALAGYLYYKGHGHPIHARMFSTLQVLHRPVGIVAAGGDVLVTSTVFERVLGRNGMNVGLHGRPRALVSGPDGLYAGLDDGRLLRISAGGAILAEARVEDAKILFLAQVAGRVFAVTDHGLGSLRAGRFASGSLDAATEADLPIGRALGALATLDGLRLVLAAERTVEGRVEPGLLVADMDAGSAPLWLAPPAGRAPTGPMVMITLAGRPTAAVALDDGTLGLLDLAGAPVWKAERVPALSPSPLGALAAVESGTDLLLVATSPRERMVVVSSPSRREILRAVPVEGVPGPLAAEGSRVHVADLESNRVDQIDAVTGLWEGRISFNVGLGSAEGCEAAVPAGDYWNAPLVMVLANRLRQLLIIDSYALDMRAGPELAPAASAPRGLVAGPQDSVWVLHESDIGRIDGASETLVARNLAHPPQRLVFAPDGSLVVGSSGRVAVYRGATLAGGLVFPGTLAHLEVQPDGRILLLWTVPGVEGLSARGGLWTTDGLAAGAPAAVTYLESASVRSFLGAISLANGPEVLYGWSEGLNQPTAFFLGSDLSLGTPRQSTMDSTGPLLAAPDRRFFAWARQGEGDNAIRVTQAINFYDGQQYDWATYRTPAPYARPTFDHSGEWMFVPLPGRDEVMVFE